MTNSSNVVGGSLSRTTVYDGRVNRALLVSGALVVLSLILLLVYTVIREAISLPAGLAIGAFILASLALERWLVLMALRPHRHSVRVTEHGLGPLLPTEGDEIAWNEIEEIRHSVHGGLSVLGREKSQRVFVSYMLERFDQLALELARHASTVRPCLPHVIRYPQWALALTVCGGGVIAGGALWAAATQPVDRRFILLCPLFILVGAKIWHEERHRTRVIEVTKDTMRFESFGGVTEISTADVVAIEVVSLQLMPAVVLHLDDGRVLTVPSVQKRHWYSFLVAAVAACPRATAKSWEPSNGYRTGMRASALRFALVLAVGALVSAVARELFR